MRGLAPALLLGTVACGAMPGASPRPTITTDRLSWKITQEEYSFRAKGTAQVQVSDTTHSYLLIYRVDWQKRLDPSDTTKTSFTSTVFVPGGHENQVELAQYESRCTTYGGSDCLRRAADPAATLTLIGWMRFENP